MPVHQDRMAIQSTLESTRPTFDETIKCASNGPFKHENAKSGVG